jgi:hypothetical protein
VISKLRDEFRGTLLRPAEEGYDEARSIFNGEIDHRPALIARCQSAAVWFHPLASFNRIPAGISAAGKRGEIRAEIVASHAGQRALFLFGEFHHRNPTQPTFQGKIKTN